MKCNWLTSIKFYFSLRIFIWFYILIITQTYPIQISRTRGGRQKPLWSYITRWGQSAIEQIKSVCPHNNNLSSRGIPHDKLLFWYRVSTYDPFFDDWRMFMCVWFIVCLLFVENCWTIWSDIYFFSSRFHDRAYAQVLF